MKSATSTRLINPATRSTSAVFGVALAGAGMHHGVLEMLQGSQPTHGAFIMAVAPGQLLWKQGTEGALTVIPNFLATGAVALVVALAASAWSRLFLARRHGPLIFLLLFIMLTLVGGGIGHIAFFVPVWAYATRIDKPLTGWQVLIARRARQVLARLWISMVTVTVVAFAIALEISIFGMVAGLGEQSTVLRICWAILAASWLLVHSAYACAAASDIERRGTSAAARGA